MLKIAAIYICHKINSKHAVLLKFQLIESVEIEKCLNT